MSGGWKTGSRLFVLLGCMFGCGNSFEYQLVADLGAPPVDTVLLDGKPIEIVQRAGGCPYIMLTRDYEDYETGRRSKPMELDFVMGGQVIAHGAAQRGICGADGVNEQWRYEKVVVDPIGDFTPLGPYGTWQCDDSHYIR